MRSTKAAPRHDEGTPGDAEGCSYPIGNLAREAGVSTRTIRYYEEIGLLKTARRYAGGRRVFPSDALERLRFIGRLKRLGFSLEEIGELNDVFEMRQSTAAMLGVLDRQLENHLNTIDEQLAELSRLRDDLTLYRERISGRMRQKKR
ncbi:MAG: MerR family transcriptional regulator [bacterium]